MSHVPSHIPKNGQIWPKMAPERAFGGRRVRYTGKAHFVGIGGIGVSALARYFRSVGWQVSGSDQATSPLLGELKREGIKIYPKQEKKNLASRPDIVIYTQVTPRDNPELKEAKKLKIPTFTYPQALGKLTKHFKTIAIAGTHGKSTATALAALAFIEAEKDPTVVIGTKMAQLKNRNFRAGKGKYLIIEADEYKDAFLNYSPTAALITNIDREHLDYFKDLEGVKKSFRKFINNLDKRGILVLNKDSAPLFQLGTRMLGTRKIVWYSLREKKLAQKIKRRLKIPGEHNLSNALAVYKLARALGVKEKDILTALSKYHGSWRRMEYKGKMKIRKSIPNTLREYSRMNSGLIRDLDVPVYDDYAHHPTEIKATLSAFREKYPKSKIICVFQPHQADRLKKLFKEFASSFDGADALILLDIFKVRGREAPSSKRQITNKSQALNSKHLAEAIRKRKNSPETIYLPHPNKLKSLLNSQLITHNSQAVIVMTGAGNIVDMTPRLLK